MTKKRRKKKRKFSLFIVLTIFLLLLYIPSTVNWFMHKTPKLGMIEEGFIENIVVEDALILRSSYVIRQSKGDEYEFVVNDAKKVQKNEIIGYYYLSSYKSLMDEKVKIEKEIENLKQNLVIGYDLYNVKIKQLMQTQENELVKAYENDFSVSKVLDLEEKVNQINSLILDEKYLLTANNSEVIKLKSTIETIETSLDNHRQEIIAPSSGILSYSVDGYETSSPIEFIYSIDYNKFQEIMAKPIKDDLNPKNIAKLITAQDYYFVFEANEDLLERIADNSYVRVSFGDLPEPFYAKIKKKIDNNEDHILLVLEVNKYLSKILDNRIVELTIHLGEVYGLKVPISSLKTINQDEMIGDIMVVRNGNVIKEAVSIKGYDEQYAIIESENINCYEMLVLEPHKVKEGQGIK